MRKEYFGKTKNGEEISLYILENVSGMRAVFTDFGAIWVETIVPDKDGLPVNVSLGYDTLAEYEENINMFGAIVGRVANRTEKASFTIDGVTYHLEQNDGENNLHTSVASGFHKRVWRAENFSDDSVTFAITSPDGDLGMPGKMEIKVTYTLTDGGAVMISYAAVCDKRCPINFTSHAYFNLDGIGSGDCKDTIIRINADQYTPVREGGIPTGEFADLEGTPMDFRMPKPIKDGFDAKHPQQLFINGGFDFSYAIRGMGCGIRKAAEAYSKKSGILLTVYHDRPSTHFYTGNWFDNNIDGRGGTKVNKWGGFAMETHGFTNAINTPSFPSPIIEPNSEYRMTTIFEFSRPSAF